MGSPRARLCRLSGHCLLLAKATEAPDTRKPVALVLGAGRGVGQAVVAKFAKEGYHAVAVRRGEGPNRLLTAEDDAKGQVEDFVKQIKQNGGEATALFYDGTEPEQVAACVKHVEENIGPIDFVCYNIGASSGSRSIEKTTYKIMELTWKMGVLGGFAAAKEVSPYMIKRGKGTIIYTSDVMSMKGDANAAYHGAAMGGRRMLTQGLHAELAPKGIHVVHVNLEGNIDAPDTFHVFAKRADPQHYKEKIDERLAREDIMDTGAIADTYYHLHQQPRSVWTQDLDMRPWTNSAWFTSGRSSALESVKKVKE